MMKSKPEERMYITKKSLYRIRIVEEIFDDRTANDGKLPASEGTTETAPTAKAGSLNAPYSIIVSGASTLGV